MGFDVGAALEGLPLQKIIDNLPTVLALLQQVGEALPAIEQGLVKAEPFVVAIATVLAGNTPTDADWDVLNAHLDENSDAIAKADVEDPATTTTLPPT